MRHTPKKRPARRAGLGKPAETGKVLGVSSGWLLAGVLGAVGLAVLNSGSEGSAPPTPATPPAPAKTGTSSQSASKPTTAKKPGLSPSIVKPYRRPLVQAASPQLHVFVNSYGGEGIFDRLKNTSSMVDGNGLNRILTLDNGEFAGFATGKEWTAPDTGQTYTQLMLTIGRIGYNYWIQKSETVQVHQQAAEAGYGLAYHFKHLTAEHQDTIQAFYFDNYTL